MLDKTGLEKKQKEQLGLIESSLSVIAHQGRAFGIHLILATQRPDANILPGQIRNNIDCRVCGRADTILPKSFWKAPPKPSKYPRTPQADLFSTTARCFKRFGLMKIACYKKGG